MFFPIWNVYPFCAYNQKEQRASTKRYASIDLPTNVRFLITILNLPQLNNTASTYISLHATTAKHTDQL